MLFMMDISFGAIVLIIFMIPTSIIMHNFWDAPDYQVWMRRYEHVGTIPVFWDDANCIFCTSGLSPHAQSERLPPLPTFIQVYNTEMIQFLKASS